MIIIFYISSVVLSVCIGYYLGVKYKKMPLTNKQKEPMGFKFKE